MGSKKEKSPVGDAAVDVDTAVVCGAGIARGITRGLPAWIVQATPSVVGVGQIPQRTRRECAGQYDILAHFPIIAIDHGAKNIRKGLIQCAWFVFVFEVGGILNDPVSDFMARYIECARQAAQFFSAIAIKHGIAIPKSIVQRSAIFIGHIDVGANASTFSIDGFAGEFAAKIIVHHSCIEMGTHCCRISPTVVVIGEKISLKTAICVDFVAHIQGDDGSLWRARHLGSGQIEHVFIGIDKVISCANLIGVDLLGYTIQICCIGRGFAIQHARGQFLFSYTYVAVKMGRSIGALSYSMV